MNKQLQQLAVQAKFMAEETINRQISKNAELDAFAEKFAELIVEECRTVIVELYRKTSLELCGPLLTADEKIAEHFYGVEE